MDDVIPGETPNARKVSPARISPLGEPVDPVEEREFVWKGKRASLARLAGPEVYVALKSLCGMLEVKYSAQHERLLNTAALHQHAKLIRMQTKGGRQPMTCLSTRRMGFWVATLQPSNIRDEGQRAMVEALQDEFADAAQAIFEDHLRRMSGRNADVIPAPPGTETPADADLLHLAEQYQELMGVLNLMGEHLSAQYQDLYGVARLMGEHLVSINLRLDRLETAVLPLSRLPEQVGSLSRSLVALPAQFEAVEDLLTTFVSAHEDQQGRIEKIDERTKHLTSAHALKVRQFVDSMVHATKTAPRPLDHREIYTRIRKKFRINSYSDMDDERFGEMMDFLRGELEKTLGNAGLPQQQGFF